MKEQLSALMDGETDLDESPHLYTALCKSDEAEACWSTYHLIGDVMRGEFRVQNGMYSKIMQQLESEPTVLAPQRRTLRERLQHRHVVPVAASFAAVAFVGWIVWQSQNVGVSPQAPTPSIAQNTLSPESLNNYMLAHHEYAPTYGMQHAYEIQPATYSETGN
jgi:sigma-E factor negative regulatory protein RseA